MLNLVFKVQSWVITYVKKKQKEYVAEVAISAGIADMQSIRQGRWIVSVAIDQ